MNEKAVSKWLVEVPGTGCEVNGLSTLVGGIAADILRAEVTLESGAPTQVVIRVLKTEFFGAESVRGALEREANVLRFLEPQTAHLNVACPRLIAVELDIDRFGGPAMIATYIPGAVEILPDNAQTWARDLAAALPQVHRLDPTDAPQPLQVMAPGPGQLPPTPPSWLNELDGNTRDAWHAVIAAASQGVPDTRAVFIHGDYHPTNVIWERGHITGIIDWTLACTGPVGIDLAHCRTNLVSLYGVEVANEFLEAYRESGHPDARDDKLQARCDAVRCWTDASVYPAWAHLGKTDLTENIVRGHLDDYAIDIAGRLP